MGVRVGLMRFRFLLPLVVVLAAPAPALAVDTLTAHRPGPVRASVWSPDRTRLRVVDPAAYVFGVGTVVRDSATACHPGVTYCVLDAAPTVIHAPAVPATGERYTVAHERGHVLDFTLCRVHRFRAAWLRVNGYPPTTPWGSHNWGEHTPPFEQFAESFAGCSRRMRWDDFQWNYGWRPTRQEYTATCRVLRREVAAYVTAAAPRP